MIKKILIISIILLILLVNGCAKKEEEPEVKIIEIIEQPEEEAEEETGTEIEDKDFRIIEVVATDMLFIPNEIELRHDENIKLIVKSAYTSEDIYNFYAPALGIFELLNKTETEIVIPTEKVGTFRFWYNVSPSDPRYKTMYGKIRIE